jgi:Family of unknown function (DUF6011)
MLKNEIDKINFERMLLAGRAGFTMVNDERGSRITVFVSKHKYKDIFFVRCNAVGDNVKGSVFVGIIVPSAGKYEFKPTTKPEVPSDHVGIRTMNWLFTKNGMRDLSAYNDLHILHLGKCCKCGRTLIEPDSIQSGIGPHCKKFVSLKKY